jgi:L-arabinose isomerase
VLANDKGLEIWFLTGQPELYGEETLRQVAEQSQAGREPAQRGRRHRAADRLEAGADECRRNPAGLPRRDSDSELRGRHHLDAHVLPAKAWIGGLDALRKPMLHFHTQAQRLLPWADIDMDFMNLNQAAHGDREFGFIETRMRVRRKTVVGHASDERSRERINRWVHAAIGWEASQNLRLARFGDNMRDVAVTEGDKVEAQMRFGMSVNTYGVNDLVAAVDAVDEAQVGALVAEYEDLYDVVPELRTGGERHDSLRYGARIEIGLRGFLEGGRLHRVHHQLRGPRRAAPTSRARGAAADGRRLRFRRRGRLEDGLLGAAAARRWPATSRAARRSWRTTPTTSARASRRSSAPTCWRCAPRSPETGRASRSTRSASAGARTRCDWCSADPAAGFVVGLLDLGERFRLVANDIEIVPADEPLPKLPVACAVWKPAPSLATSAEAWLMAGGPAPHLPEHRGALRDA